jgi:phage gp36-like protein
VPYTEVPDVRAILTNDPLATQGTAASVPEAVIITAIEDAQEEVDATLRSRYTVPFVTVPKLIAQITRDIAALLADLVYRQEKDYDSIDREPLLMRVARARAILGKLADGSFILPPAAGEDPAGAIGEATVINQYEPALFNKQAILGHGDKAEYGEYDVYGPIRYGEYVAFNSY